VVFCNHKIDSDDPALMDVAPTALHMFGIEPPDYMEGRTLFRDAPDLRNVGPLRG
jgi:arylsulfatase A-like enzyme